MYFTHRRLCGHRLQWAWFLAIYLAPGDADAPQYRLTFSDMGRNCRQRLAASYLANCKAALLYKSSVLSQASPPGLPPTRAKLVRAQNGKRRKVWFGL